VIDGRNRLDALTLIGKLWDDTGNLKPDICSLVGSCPVHYGPNFDPYAYVISKNIHRRHLTTEQRRDLIAKLLKAKPETSNNQIAKQVKADDKTVAKVRAKLEATSDIPKLKKTKGADGKERPTKRKSAEITFAKPCSPRRQRVFVQESFNSPEEAHGKFMTGDGILASIDIDHGEMVESALLLVKQMIADQRRQFFVELVKIYADEMFEVLH
jgi:hypothetical protein